MFLLHESRKDWYLVTLVLLLSVGANLPQSLSDAFFINRQFLMIALALLVAVSLVRYLKFTLVLVVAILAIGANLPEQIAQELGVSKLYLILTLIVMVVMSLVNKKTKKLKTGLDKQDGAKSTHGATALFQAISHGREEAVEQLIRSGVNVNVRTVTGMTPLIFAASKGHTTIVRVLLDNKARLHAATGKGQTALDLAEAAGFLETAEVLRLAESSAANDDGQVPVEAAAPAA